MTYNVFGGTLNLAQPTKHCRDTETPAAYKTHPAITGKEKWRRWEGRREQEKGRGIGGERM